MCVCVCVSFSVSVCEGGSECAERAGEGVWVRGGWSEEGGKKGGYAKKRRGMVGSDSWRGRRMRRACVRACV